MNTTRVVLAVVLVGFAAGCANVERSRDIANPNVSGNTLALQVCSNCHGRTGNSTSPNFPNLAQQQEAYLTSQLHEFKNHSREDPAGFEYMWGLSHNLTDKQIQELATHFASQKLEPQPVEASRVRSPQGKPSSLTASPPAVFLHAAVVTARTAWAMQRFRASPHSTRTIWPSS